MNIVFAKNATDGRGLSILLSVDKDEFPTPPQVGQTVWLKSSYRISEIGWRFTEEEDDAMVCILMPIK